MATHASNWTSQEVKFLVSVWVDQSVLSILESKKRNTGAYERMVDLMKSGGYTRTKEQIQVKYNTTHHPLKNIHIL